MINEKSPEVYCGTYHKYNCGSIKGSWIKLDQFASSQEFLDECLKIHEDEKDPELMFQDFQDFPESFYRESSLDDRLWEWLTLDDNDRDLWEAFLCYDNCADFRDAQDRFLGSANSLEDFAQEWLESTGVWTELSDFARTYFDLDRYVRDLEIELITVNLNGKVWVFSY